MRENYRRCDYGAVTERVWQHYQPNHAGAGAWKPVLSRRPVGRPGFKVALYHRSRSAVFTGFRYAVAATGYSPWAV